MNIETYVKNFGKREADAWKSVMFLYGAALKKMETKLIILNDEFKYTDKYNPIEYIKSRIKKPDSIAKKLKRNGHSDDIESMVKHCRDIAGIRLVCSFTSDIYKLVERISTMTEITVLSTKDYISNPKESGYKSYHLQVNIPVRISDERVDIPVEVQIRTIAMDFWASLEHKIYYKFEGDAPEYIRRDLQECSDIVSMLDAKMLQLNEAILEAKKNSSQNI